MLFIFYHSKLQVYNKFLGIVSENLIYVTLKFIKFVVLNLLKLHSAKQKIIIEKLDLFHFCITPNNPYK